MSGTSLLQDDTEVRLHSATLVEALDRIATTDCTLTFVERSKQPVVLPYTTLRDRAAAWAHHLVATGLEPGGRAMILLPTSEDWVCAYFGTLLAGGVPVPVGPTFSIGGLDKHVDTLSHIAANCEATHFFGSARVEPYLSQIFAQGALRAFVNPKDVPAAGGPPAGKKPLPTPSGSDLALLQYTSGTTSMPKGVELQHRSLLANAWAIGERTGMNPADVGVSWLPLFHDMGLIGALLTSLYWHYPLTLMTPELFLMQPRRWMEVMSEHRATLTVAPNFAYKTAIVKTTRADVEKLDLRAWRVGFNGSEQVLGSTLREFADHFGPAGVDPKVFYPVYGMAENCLAATFPDRARLWESIVVDRDRLEVERRAESPAPAAAPGARHREVVSVGRPVAATSVAVEGADGAILGEGHVGEILVRGPCLTRGYFRNPEATERTLRRGWLHTGDLGFVSDGRLFVTGREKEMIIVRGRNYYPHDVEHVVGRLLGDSSGGAAAVGVSDEADATERLVLLVEVESKSRLGRTHEELAKEINAELIGAFGIRAEPVVFVKNRTLPRTTSGKLQRTACARLFTTGEYYAAE